MSDGWGGQLLPLQRSRSRYWTVNPYSFANTAGLCHLFTACWGSGPDMLRASNYPSQHRQTIKCFIIKCASEEQMKCILASLTCATYSFFENVFILQRQNQASWSRLDKSCWIIVTCPSTPLPFHYFYWYFCSVYYNTCISPSLHSLFICRCVWH